MTRSGFSPQLVLKSRIWGLAKMGPKHNPDANVGQEGPSEKVGSKDVMHRMSCSVRGSGLCVSGVPSTSLSTPVSLLRLLLDFFFMGEVRSGVCEKGVGDCWLLPTLPPVSYSSQVQELLTIFSRFSAAPHFHCHYLHPLHLRITPRKL